MALVVHDSPYTDNIAGSGPFTLRLVGSNGTTNVPTVPTTNTLGNPTPTGTLVPGTNIPIKTLTAQKKSTGLKGFVNKVGDFFKKNWKKVTASG